MTPQQFVEMVARFTPTGENDEDNKATLARLIDEASTILSDLPPPTGDVGAMMSERENYCENCAFVQRREPDSVSLVFGWCNIPLPPHIYQWEQRLSERAVAPKYSCALFQPANTEPQG